MRLLIDTHVALWLFGDCGRLSQQAADVLRDESNSLHLSIASAWEITKKAAINKLELDGGIATFLDNARRHQIKLLPIEPEHIKSLERLPFIHRDPFDRLLVATALAEGMPVVTADENIRRHEVSCVW